MQRNSDSNKIIKIKEEILDRLKDEIENLPSMKKILFVSFFSRIFDLLSNDCDEEDIAYSVNSLTKINSEYIREEDYLSYDKAMALLHFGNNRVAFCELMKRHNIKNRKFNNCYIGFPKSKILALASDMKEELAKKEKKLLLKEQRAACLRSKKLREEGKVYDYK